MRTLTLRNRFTGFLKGEFQFYTGCDKSKITAVLVKMNCELCGIDSSPFSNEGENISGKKGVEKPKRSWPPDTQRSKAIITNGIT